MKRAVFLFVLFSYFGVNADSLKAWQKNCYAASYGRLVVKFSQVLEEKTMSLINEQASGLSKEDRLAVLKSAKFKMEEKACEVLPKGEYLMYVEAIKYEFEDCLNYRNVEAKDRVEVINEAAESIFQKVGKGKKIEFACAESLIDSTQVAKDSLFHGEPTSSCKRLVNVINNAVKDCKNKL